MDLAGKPAAILAQDQQLWDQPGSGGRTVVMPTWHNMAHSQQPPAYHGRQSQCHDPQTGQLWACPWRLQRPAACEQAQVATGGLCQSHTRWDRKGTHPAHIYT
jgi:hypothetical protein